MNGYELIEKPRRESYYYRQIKPTAASLTEALALLPPDAEIEVLTGPEQAGWPTSVTYWPSRNEASIG